MKTNITTQDIPMLLDGLRRGFAKVNFTKKNGEDRTMICTLNPALIPDEHAPKGSEVVVDEEEPELVRVFDTEKQGWRSIIFASVLNFEAVS